MKAPQKQNKILYSPLFLSTNFTTAEKIRYEKRYGIQIRTPTPKPTVSTIKLSNISRLPQERFLIACSSLKLVILGKTSYVPVYQSACGGFEENLLYSDHLKNRQFYA